MKNNWSNLQTQFWSRGFCVIDDFFSEDYIEKWKDTVLFLSELSLSEKLAGVNHINKKFDKPDLSIRDGAGSYKFVSIDGRMSFSKENFPGLIEYYSSTSHFLSLFTGLDIVTSEDKQSAVTMMNYSAPGGEIAAHFDTNLITFLLYLTDNPDEGGTRILPIDKLRPTNLNHPDEVIGESEIIYPKTGRILIFQGRRLWHSSEPVYKSNKISSVWNYYLKDDQWRPTEVSQRLYK